MCRQIRYAALAIAIPNLLADTQRHENTGLATVAALDRILLVSSHGSYGQCGHRLLSQLLLSLLLIVLYPVLCSWMMMMMLLIRVLDLCGGVWDLQWFGFQSEKQTLAALKFGCRLFGPILRRAR
jgi:hypothetical protein